MTNKALVVIDLQNDITKNYREIIDTVNQAVDWAVENEIERRVQQSKVKTLTDDVLPYLHRFTDNVHSYGTNIPIKQMLIEN